MLVFLVILLYLPFPLKLCYFNHPE